MVKDSSKYALTSHTNSLGDLFDRKKKNQESSNSRKKVERKRSKSINVASLTRSPSQNRHGNYCAILFESNNFTYFQNGEHKHAIDILPCLLEKSDDNRKQSKGFLGECAKMRSKLPNFLKTNSNTYQSRLDDTTDALSLVPTRYKKIGITDTSKHEPIREKNSIPTIVNKHSIIGSIQLELITELSKEIENLFRESSNKNNDESTYRNRVSFQNRYGNYLTDIGDGSYGIIKIYRRDLKPTLETEKSTTAFHTYSNRSSVFYAVKEFKSKRPGHSVRKYSTNIISEFIIGNSLSHLPYDSTKKGKCPFIINIFDLVEIEHKRLFQVMELCPCGDMYMYLHKHTKSKRNIHAIEADCFMKQLLYGVRFMHLHGVAHCDIKLENILLYPDGLLKLCDFGSSTVFQTGWETNLHKESHIIGTEPYLAPEEYYYDKSYDPRLADCWSCGMVYMTLSLGKFMWKVANTGNDLSFERFVKEMRTKGKFQILEDLKHVDIIKQTFRKQCLYEILVVDPNYRITVSEVLQTPWMKQTCCCQDK